MAGTILITSQDTSQQLSKISHDILPIQPLSSNITKLCHKFTKYNITISQVLTILELGFTITRLELILTGVSSAKPSGKPADNKFEEGAKDGRIIHFRVQLFFVEMDRIVDPRKSAADCGSSVAAKFAF